MKKETMIMVVGIGLMAISTIVLCLNHQQIKRLKNGDIEVSIKLEQPEFMLQETPDSASVMDALLYYHVQHPEIVLHQAILETGNFRSNVCKTHNNLFGLYDSRLERYYRFDHWTDSIKAYLRYIQYKYNPKKDLTYYDFLDRIGYAEDENYNNKLKYLITKK